MIVAGTDLSGPIPADTVRVSIRYGGWLYVCDFDTARVMEAVANFETYAGTTIRLARTRGTWVGVEGASSIANYAVRSSQHYILAVAAIWMFLNRPDDEDALKRLNSLIERDGGAWIVATTDENGIQCSRSARPTFPSMAKRATRHRSHCPTSRRTNRGVLLQIRG
jgi:hypothetical protein